MSYREVVCMRGRFDVCDEIFVVLLLVLFIFFRCCCNPCHCHNE